MIPLFALPTIHMLCDTTSHHQLIASIHKKQLENYKYMSPTHPTSPEPRLVKEHKINKFNVFNISIMTSYKNST